jgi:hypothetical protein
MRIRHSRRSLLLTTGLCLACGLLTIGIAPSGATSGSPAPADDPAPGWQPTSFFGGRVRAVCPVGNLAWLAEGHRVWAVDLANPAQPQPHGPGLLLEGPVDTLAVDGKLGVALVGPLLHTLDLNDPNRPRLLGTVAIAQLRRVDDTVSVRQVLVHRGAAYLHFIQRLEDSYDLPTIFGNMVVDLGQPTRPAIGLNPLVALAENSQLSELHLVGTTLVAKEVDWSRNNVERLHLLDLRNPLQPREGQPIDEAPAVLAVRQDSQPPRLVGLNLDRTARRATLTEWNVSDVDAPQQARRDEFTIGDTWYGHDSAVVHADGLLYVSGGQPLGSFYIAGGIWRVNPRGEQPWDRVQNVATSIRPPDSPLATMNGRLVAGVADGLLIFDPKSEEGRDRLPLVVDAVAVAGRTDAAGRTLFVNVEQSGLFSLDAANASDPVVLDMAPGGETTQLTIGDGMAAVDFYGGTDIHDRSVHLTDVSARSAVSPAGRIDLTGFSGTSRTILMAQSGPLLAVGMERGHVGIYALANGVGPQLTGSVDLDGRTVVDVAMDEGRLAILSIDDIGDGFDRELPLYLALYAVSAPAGRLVARRLDEVMVVDKAWTEGGFSGAKVTIADGWLAVSLAKGCGPQTLDSGVQLFRSGVPTWQDKLLPGAWLPDITGSTLMIHDGYLFAAGAKDGVAVVDLRQAAARPWAWRLIGQLAAPWASSITAVGHTVYVSQGEEGVAVFEPNLDWASDPAAPSPTTPPTPLPLTPTATHPACDAPSPSPTAYSTPSPTVPPIHTATAAQPTHTVTATAVPLPKPLHLPWLENG